MNNPVQVNAFIKKEKPLFQRVWTRVKKERQLWAICIPMIIFVLIFAYYPMYELLLRLWTTIPGSLSMEASGWG